MTISSTGDTAETESIAITASVPVVGNFEFHIHIRPDQYISGNLLRDKIWEPFETKIFCRLCQHGDVVADLGANIGWYSVIASRLVGPTGRVFSFEPDSTNLVLLTKNVLGSGHAEQIEIRDVALAERESSSRLFLSDYNLGDHRLFDDGTPRDSVVVKVSTLDAQFANSPRRPTLLKSDTQGSEARILRGASELFADGWRPILIMEFWPYGLINSGDDPLELFEKLESFGYELYELTEENPTLNTLTRERMRVRLMSHISPQSKNFVNLVCLPYKSKRSASIADLIATAFKPS